MANGAYDGEVRRVEFTIAPFVDGDPGPHVTRAIEAAEAHGADVEIGPFGSSCLVDDDRCATVVAAVLDAAFAHGADHVDIDVSAVGAPPASPGEDPTSPGGVGG